MIRVSKRVSRAGGGVLPEPGAPRGRWEGIPLFARPLLDGCWEEDAPPRLQVEDLQDPQSFHARLAAWLMKQH